MKEYTAAYLDNPNSILNIQESLKKLENSKVSRIYNSPTLESIEEQVQVAKLQNCDTLNILLSDLSDRVGLEEDLNTLYGNHFQGGIRLLPIKEDESNGGVISQQQVQTIPNSPESKPNMIIFNPFGTLLFDESGHLHPNVVAYIKGAFDFIERYSSKCKAVYFIDSRIDNNKAVSPSTTLGSNWGWLKSNSIDSSNSDNLEDFFYTEDINSSDNSFETPARFQNLRIIRDTYKNKGEFSKIRIPQSYIYMDYEMFTALNDVGLRGFATSEFNLIGNTVGEWAKNKQGAGVKLDVKSPYENKIADSLISVKNEIEVSMAENPNKTEVPMPDKSSVESYMVLLFQLLDTSPNALKSIEDSKSGIPLSSRSSNKYVNDRMYKNQKLDRMDKDTYWSSGNNNEYVNPEESDEFKKKATRDIDKFLLNKEVDGSKFTDKTLEKIYNLKYLPKDLLGISNDNEMERFNYKRYDSEDKKIPGVAGIQVYKIEKRKNDIAKEIDDINLQIEELDDSDYDDSEKIKELNKKIKELSNEEDDLNAALDSARRDSDAKAKINKVNLDNQETDENGQIINKDDTETINLKKNTYRTLALSDIGKSVRELMIL